MDYIKTSDIVDPNIQMPWTGPIIDFLQNRNTQSNKAFAYAMLGESLYNYSIATAGVVVAGCTKSGTGNTIFNGWIFWQNELYYFPGASGLLAYANVPVFLLDETNDVTVGSVEFSDSIFRYVTKVRRLKVADQASGTGLFDMSSMGRFISDTEVIPSTYAGTGAVGYEDITGATFTSPPRICDLEVVFEYEIKLEQITSGNGGVNPTVELFGPGILKAANHRMSGFGAAANQKTTTRGSITHVYRNCPANQVIKARFIGNTLVANEVGFSGMSLKYKEILRPKLW